MQIFLEISTNLYNECGSYDSVSVYLVEFEKWRAICATVDSVGGVLA